MFIVSRPANTCQVGDQQHGSIQMQVQRLPSTVHKELDKYVRRCVWGDSDSEGKTHLVN